MAIVAKLISSDFFKLGEDKKVLSLDIAAGDDLQLSNADVRNLEDALRKKLGYGPNFIIEFIRFEKTSTCDIEVTLVTDNPEAAIGNPICTLHDSTVTTGDNGIIGQGQNFVSGDILRINCTGTGTCKAYICLRED